MNNLYPLFEQNRILKKEMLLSLREYSFAHIQLEYQNYIPGLIQGCDVRVKGNEIVVFPGILKIKDFLFLLTEPESISYTAMESQQYLKLKVTIDDSHLDGISYHAELRLDTQEERGENEFELCRFYLRKGASLRDSYTDFFDMETEYDTINLIYASWSSIHGPGMAPTIMRYYADQILKGERSQQEDRCIAYQCLSGEGTIPLQVLSAYLRYRLGEGEASDPYEAYVQMGKVLKKTGLEKSVQVNTGKKRNYIIVD